MPQFTEDTLPLDLAYYVGAAPARLPAFLSWQMAFSAAAGLPQTLQLTPEDWESRAVTARFVDGQVRLAATANFGSISRKVTVDLDRVPDLVIDVPATQGAWAVKVNDGGGDIVLIADTSQIGEYLMDVPARTDWHGVKTFAVELWAVGGPNQMTTVSGLHFLPSVPAPGPRGYIWEPHQVIADGSSADGGAVSLEAMTGMPDENTVSQCLRVVKIGTKPLRLLGQFNDGTIQWDADHQVLRLQNTAYSARTGFQSSYSLAWSTRLRPGLAFAGGRPGNEIRHLVRGARQPQSGRSGGGVRAFRSNARVLTGRCRLSTGAGKPSGIRGGNAAKRGGVEPASVPGAAPARLCASKCGSQRRHGGGRAPLLLPGLGLFLSGHAAADA